MRLNDFENRDFHRGASKLKEFLWMIVNAAFFESWLPGSGWRVVLLKMFGAQVGCRVVVKPRVRIKFPWRVSIGDYSWIGEGVWIDNLARVTIGTNTCLSQGSYICTGSHDWELTSFDLIARPIELSDKAWICARATVGPGVTVGEGAVLTLNSVATSDLSPWHIHLGNPATPIRKRKRV